MVDLLVASWEAFMKKIEIPKEQLYQKYVVENLTRYECAAFFNVNEKAIIRRLKEYDIKKDPNLIQKNRERTLQKVYGVKVPFHNETIKDKAKQTMLNRFGVEYTAQSKELTEKMQTTMLKRYGKKVFFQTKDFQDKSNTTCLEKYGVQWPCQAKQCVESLESACGHSKPEQEFSQKLEQNSIKYTQEYPIRGFKYDFKVDNYLFEINPTVTHNSLVGLFNKKPKEKNYHFIKHSVAMEFGFHCVHVFDWDDPDKIISVFLAPKDKIYARKCTIQAVSVKEAREFIEKYHLQGYAKDEIRIGLYYNEELVMIMTFGKPRYNKNYQYELVRLCSKANVIGGAERIFNYFVKIFNPESVVSYCDIAKFSGETYRKLGFVCKGKPKPSKHWFNIKTNQHITDNLLRQKGFDQLFKTNYGKGTSNEELMIQNFFLPVYDCGQVTYVKSFKTECNL